jgi:hypothetical protein
MRMFIFYVGFWIWFWVVENLMVSRGGNPGSGRRIDLFAKETGAAACTGAFFVVGGGGNRADKERL